MSFEGYANYNMSHVQPLQPRKQRTPAPSGQPGQHEYRRSDVLESTASAVRPGSSRTGSYNTPEGYDTRAVPSQQSTRLAQAVSDRQRPSSQLSFASVSDLDDEDSRGLPQMHQDVYVEEEPISSAPVAKTPKAMNTVMAAFSDAGRRFNQQQNQVPAKAKTRKTAFGEQGESARMKRLQQEFPATPAFRAIERVLAQIAQNWPMLLPQDLPDEGPFGNDADDHFNPVPLALALLDPASIDQSASQLNHFLQLKEDLGDALKSHIQLHYRAFDASVSAYNGVVANLRAAQKQVSGLRSNIGNVTKVLGSRREELAGMVSRRDELSEMCRILDTM